MNIAILPEAEAELQDGVAYYDRESRTLGDRFANAYLDALDRIAASPRLYPRRGRDFRQCRLKKFPYALVYRIQRQTIIVIAVAHLSRKPEYWRGRLS